MLTVAILTYNSGQTIEECLESVAKQTTQPGKASIGEVLIIDDDSSDDTLLKVRQAQERLGLPIRVLHNGSHNISQGRNIGMREAKNPAVVFLDSDAFADEGWLTAIESGFEQINVAAVGGEVVAAYNSKFAEAVAGNDSTIRKLFSRGTSLLCGGNMAVHLDRLAGQEFDPTWVHAEDIEFISRLPQGREWVFVADARVRHESRADPRKYLHQMYKYGLWKVRYGVNTGDVRLIDYVPTVVIVGSSILAVVWSPWWVFSLAGLSVAETVFVALYSRPSPSLWSRMLEGWLIKNTGWGVGVLVGLAEWASSRPTRRIRLEQ
jgi:glycosyltransferase involved in cell wall biosynthesis